MSELPARSEALREALGCSAARAAELLEACTGDAVAPLLRLRASNVLEASTVHQWLHQASESRVGLAMQTAIFEEER